MGNYETFKNNIYRQYLNLQTEFIKNKSDRNYIIRQTPDYTKIESISNKGHMQKYSPNQVICYTKLYEYNIPFYKEDEIRDLIEQEINNISKELSNYIDNTEDLYYIIASNIFYKHVLDKKIYTYSSTLTIKDIENSNIYKNKVNEVMGYYNKPLTKFSDVEIKHLLIRCIKEELWENNIIKNKYSKIIN